MPSPTARTGKGNDQVRFDVASPAWRRSSKGRTPAQASGYDREDASAYGERFGMPAPVARPITYSIDLNLLGRQC